jgi:putative FmdB family regulatory protein
MPLYEYRCASCGEVFEVIQKFTDEPLHQHAKCGGEVVRLISPSALQFKGSGWYVTDYANGSRTEGSKESKSKTESSEPAKDSGKKDSAKDSTKSAESSASNEKAKSET